MVIASPTWGAPSVLLENRTADCPVLFGDELAPPGECFAKIYWSYGDMKMGLVVVATNGSAVVPISQPGYFDAGVGLLTPAPDFVEGETYLCYFEMHVWRGNPNNEFSGDQASPVVWVQPIKYSTSSSLEPLRITIPESSLPYIWIGPYMEWVHVQHVFTPMQGGGKTVIYPEGTEAINHPWPLWGPVTLHAVPDLGYRFANWRGRYCDPDYVSAMGYVNYFNVISTNEWVDFTFGRGSAMFLATFIPGWHLETAVPYGGSIAQTPEGTDFDPGTAVTLTAKSRPNFAFSHWSGDAQGTNPVITLKLDTDRTAVAHFTPTVVPQLIMTSRDAVDGASTNGFQLTLLGIPGQTYCVEFSPDLAMWVVHTQLTATNRETPIRDPATLSDPRRFYRARTVTP